MIIFNNFIEINHPSTGEVLWSRSSKWKNPIEQKGSHSCKGWSDLEFFLLPGIKRCYMMKL